MVAEPNIDYQQAIFSFTDGVENTSTWKHYVAQGLLGAFYGDLDPLYSALAAVTDAAMEKVTLTFTGTDPTKAGAAGIYDVVEDKAKLLFQASDNSTVVVEVPAPKASMFLPDERST